MVGFGVGSGWGVGSGSGSGVGSGSGTGSGSGSGVGSGFGSVTGTFPGTSSPFWLEVVSVLDGGAVISSAKAVSLVFAGMRGVQLSMSVAASPMVVHFFIS